MKYMVLDDDRTGALNEHGISARVLLGMPLLEVVSAKNTKWERNVSWRSEALRDDDLKKIIKFIPDKIERMDLSENEQLKEDAMSWLGEKCDVISDDSCFRHLQFVNLSGNIQISKVDPIAVSLAERKSLKEIDLSRAGLISLNNHDGTNLNFGNESTAFALKRLNGFRLRTNLNNIATVRWLDFFNSSMLSDNIDTVESILLEYKKSY